MSCRDQYPPWHDALPRPKDLIFTHTPESQSHTSHFFCLLLSIPSVTISVAGSVLGRRRKIIPHQQLTRRDVRDTTPSTGARRRLYPQDLINSLNM